MSKQEKSESLLAFFRSKVWPIHFLISSKFRDFIDKIPDAVFLSDKEGNIIQHNLEATSLSGYEHKQLEEMKIEALLPPKMRKNHVSLRETYFKKPFCRLMGEGGLKLCLYDQSGQTIPIEATLFYIETDKGVLAVNIIRDVSEQVKEKQKIENKAFHDELTGLPNRHYLYETAERMMAQAKRDNAALMVLIVDLDKFKPVNDNYGHDAGDLLLKELGKRLDALRRKNEFVARFGGDEFVFLCMTHDEDDHEALPKRIIDACERPFKIKGERIQISCSVGMAIDKTVSTSLADLLKTADTQLYHAKKTGE